MKSLKDFQVRVGRALELFADKLVHMGSDRVVAHLEQSTYHLTFDFPNQYIFLLNLSLIETE